MLGTCASEEVKNSSVIAAKFTQTLAQALFILLGLVFLLQGNLELLKGRERFIAMGALLVIVALVSCALFVLCSPNLVPKKFAPISTRLRLYLQTHPGRFALSILFFALGYAWGALEVLLIGHFMGLSIPVTHALAIEILSNIVDSILFMVPAKAGTQEAGKTAIFHALGYQPSQGLAFGLIRHARELLWAGGGFLLYVLSRREHQALRPAELPSLARPFAGAD
jgi:hypothetical protein